jgi:L-2,4-diaminobutyrate decarboxylase
MRAPTIIPPDRAVRRSSTTHHLLSDASLPAYRQQMRQAVDAVTQAIAAADRPFSGVVPADLRPLVESIDLGAPLDSMPDALQEVRELYLRDAVYFHSPRYAAHLNCPVAIPAVVAEAVLSAVNSSLDTWDQSAGATLIEQRLVRWTAARIGFGAGADGVFTSGGSLSNLQGLLMARNNAVEAKGLVGLASLPEKLAPLRIFASTSAHFTVEKSAGLLGLGADAVVQVPADPHRRMRIDALEAALAAHADAGLVPMAVVATAGTTDYGSVDPLAGIAALCRRYGAWLHVDAAYGGGLLVSHRHRALLDGIEHADSVTVDYHKTFFQPVSSSAVIVRDATMLRHVTLHADYLNPEGGENPNQVDKSLQTTRRFDALKLWLTLRTIGADGIGDMLDDVIDLARATAEELREDPSFELAAPVQLSTVVFRLVPAGWDDDTRVDRLNARIRKSLFAAGDAVIAGTTLHGRTYLKFTFLNPATTLEDVRAILAAIRSAGDPTIPEGGTRG